MKEFDWRKNINLFMANGLGMFSLQHKGDFGRITCDFIQIGMIIQHIDNWQLIVRSIKDLTDEEWKGIMERNSHLTKEQLLFNVSVPPDHPDFNMPYWLFIEFLNLGVYPFPITGDVIHYTDAKKRK